MNAWAEDLLGPGFEALTLPLLPDDDGTPVATLIRYVPQDDPESLPGAVPFPTADATGATGVGASANPEAALPRFVVLAIHGWNDYFFQRELARNVAAMGGAFYAIDLRKYGRSHQEGEPWGYMTNLSVYDEDLHEAFDVIHHELGTEIPRVLYGHSTGGLTAALWADRHPGALAGVVLNSPWIEFQGATITRQIGQPVLDVIARNAPSTVIPLSDSGTYQRLLTGYRADDELEADFDLTDPFVTGWEPDERYRHFPTFPIRFGWLNAILQGHEHVAAGLAIDCPILVMTSARSMLTSEWSAEMRSADIVLDVEQIWKRVPGLGSNTTLIKFDGAIHDITLSRRDVRTQVFDSIGRWAQAWV